MLTLLLLASLVDSTPRHVRLVADVRYETMTRAELQAEYDALEARRPGLFVPLSLIGLGLAGGVISAVAFWIPFSTPYGLAVYSAAILIAAFVVSIAMVATGTALWVRRKPERDAIGAELERLEDAYREGRCRNVEGQRPCEKDPNTGPSFPPQVEAPGPGPGWVLAVF